jgi:hypothetical protein
VVQHVVEAAQREKMEAAHAVEAEALHMQAMGRELVEAREALAAANAELATTRAAATREAAVHHEA